MTPPHPRPRPRRAPAGRLWSGACAAALLAACAADPPPTEPRTPPRLAVVSGDGQQGDPGSALPEPIAVRLTDAAGLPRAGVTVRFAAAGGAVAPAAAVTDADGVARGTWTVGPGQTAWRATAAADGAAPVTFTATAGGEPPFGAVRLLGLETYDGSNETVHPDVVAAPTGAAAWPLAPHRALLAITPYPGGNAAFENPSAYVGAGPAWRAPAGTSNPLARPGAGAYLSDPDVVYDPDAARYRVYFREVSDRNYVKFLESADGVRWGAPRPAVDAPNHALVSPSVVRRGAGDWWMFAVNGRGGCGASDAGLEVRQSADGERWSAPRAAVLDQPGRFPWHVDATWVPARAEFWAVYNAKTPGSCTTAALYLATSPDGVRWRAHPSPVLARGAIPEFADVVYRGSVVYDAAADVVTLWYSGARYQGGRYVWRSATERVSRAALFARVGAPQLLAPLPTSAPPLTDPP